MTRLLAALVLVSLATATSASAQAPDSTDARRRQALGVSAGIPQILALTWEIEPRNMPLRFQANLGTVLVIWSANGRLLVVPNAWRVQPYAFAGGGTFLGFGIEDFDGWEPYVWMGYGLRLRVQRILVFAEMSFLEGTDEVSGPAVGGGVLFRY